MSNNLINNIFKINSQLEFENLSLEVFQFQYKNNNIYKDYVDFLGVDSKKIKKIYDIPFLPISFFKNLKITSTHAQEEIVFYSSGTTGSTQSKHFVLSKNLYHQSFTNTFEKFYGPPSDYCFLALLPGYLEREGSSLIYMVNDLMKQSKSHDSGFYLNNYEQLANKINSLKVSKQKFILIGVTYALLDFANLYPIDLRGGIVMETGGMKGKRKELLKEEVHEILKEKFNLKQIHSEYGMTELLTQAYSQGNAKFTTPNWMKVLIRDTYDPFSYLPKGKSGGINIIDLANLYSCSFIETKDLGRLNQNGQFEIIGRFDNSDIRGCNLLVS